MKNTNTPTLRSILDAAFELKAKKRLVEAEIKVRQGLDLYPSSPPLCALLANILLSQNRPVEAEIIAEAVLENDPDNLRALTVLANVQYRKRNFEQAILLYRQALAIEEQPYLRFRLAMALKETNELPEALAEIETALRGSSENPSYLKCKGAILKKMGRHEEAVQTMEGVLKNTPQDDFAYKTLVDLKIEGKPPEEAAREIEKLLKISVAAKNPQLHARLGDLLKEARKFSAAEAAYRKAIEIDPGNRYLRERLGFCYSKMHDFQRVIETLSPIFLEDPSSFYVRTTLFAAFRKSNAYPEMLALLKEALGRHPEMSWLWGEIRKVEKILGSV